ncbi:RNA12 protein-domain-containing protein [Pilobolus umbonatus]|nr:RNA12 protein-domain-containing protein [Pilobolus umbonatus]
MLSRLRAHTHCPGDIRGISLLRKPSSYPRTINVQTRYFQVKNKLHEEYTHTQKVTEEITAYNITKEQLGQLYLDNVFPLKMNILDIRQLVLRNSRGFLESKTHQAIPSNELPYDFCIKEIIARTKDGGALVSFSYKASEATKSTRSLEIIERITDHIKEKGIVAPFNFKPVRAFLVKGRPFIEDILARYPTPRLRLEFQGEAVGAEQLYRHFRPYGKIFDISLYPNPSLTKDPTRYAVVQFTRIRFAATARNCLHGYVINDTRLNILYEKQMNTNVVKDWLVNHPRITIPILAAIVAACTYVIFDPIRIFFSISKITQRFNPEEYAIYTWLRNETWAKLLPSHDQKDEQSMWAHDQEKIGKLKSWLAEDPETFIVITGHKGSGKSALVKAAIADRKNKLFIDCEFIGSASNSSGMTKNLAKEVGYFPVFTWLSSITGVLDTVVTATTGQKTNFTSSSDSQMKDILETVAIALRNIVPSEREARERAEEEKARGNLFDRIKNYIKGVEAVKKSEKESISNEVDSDDEWDEENIPIVVIDNYMYRDTGKNSYLWEELAEWAALLIENEVAHVIFVSSNASVMKSLSKALPTKSFSNIALADAPPEMALSYIKRQLGVDVEDPEMNEVVAAIGGRLTELELLVQKLKMNMDPKAAFEDIVVRNVIEILKYGFGELNNGTSSSEWTAVQFWNIVKQLSSRYSINYDKVKWSRLFNGSDAPLQAMERAELITISYKDGRPVSIKALPRLWR